MDIVFFVYGLAFVLLGVAVFVQPRKYSEYALAHFIWLLAAFGLVHGILEWTDLWKIVRGGSPFLRGLQLVLLISSFILLFEFSRRLLKTALSADNAWRKLLDVKIYVAVFLVIAGGAWAASDPVLGLIVWTRYALGFPAALGAGLGLHYYFKHRVEQVLSEDELLAVRRYFMLGTATFSAYGILAGLVVPVSDFFPANRVNDQAFLSLTGVPVQLFRAACAVLAALAVAKILCIFHFEGRNKLLESLATIRQINDRNELILQTAAEGIIGIDSDGQVIFINKAALSRLGYDRADELVGDNLHARVHHTSDTGQPNSVENCPIHLSLVDGCERRLDNEIFWRKEGTSFPVEFTCAPFHADGATLGGVIVFQDITERKQAETVLKRLNQELESRVAAEVEKNREKEHYLFQQSRLASMGEMIGYIAHHWRQPLNTIGLVLANIQDAYRYQELNETYLNEQVTVGSRVVQKMSATIDDFRDFSRPNKDKELFSVADAVRNSISLIEPSFKSSEIELGLQVEGDANILGHYTEFQQVIMNLLNNAQDILKERKVVGGKVLVSVASAAGKLRVSVRDNGGGINDEVRHKIFDPYFTTKECGIGIGLYLAKIIVEKHMGGQIEARNLDGGAEFVIACPVS